MNGYKQGYKRSKVVLSNGVDPAYVAIPGVHRIASLLKWGLLGTHQGTVSGKHLDYYLDEYRAVESSHRRWPRLHFATADNH